MSNTDWNKIFGNSGKKIPKLRKENKNLDDLLKALE